jgi:signal transduction histidine kinase/CheY-like chemotaxis protein
MPAKSMTPATAPPSLPREAEVQRQVRAHLVAQFYATVKQQFLPVFVITPLWGSMFYMEYRRPAILWWVGITMAAQILRLTLNLRYRAQPHTHADPQRWEKQAWWTAVVSGLTYAAGPWTMFDSQNQTFNALLMLWFLGMIAGAAPALASMRKAMVWFCSITGFSLALCMASGGTGLYLGQAIGSAVATVVFIWFGLQTHRLQASSLRRGLEKNALAEDLERQVQIAREASAEKSRFLAAASHDLRQPLHALTLFGEALRRKYANAPDAADLDRLMQSVLALNASLNTMLDISRLDAGVVPVNLRPVDLNTLFAALRQTYLARAESRQLSLRFRSGGRWVLADPHLLERLLGNLVENAIKYTETGGVLVCARPQRGPDGTPQVRLEVRDSGLGIPKEHHTKVFDEFFQLGNPGRDRSQGLGIGLSIVKRLVQLHGLHLGLRSASGCGSTFSLLLTPSATRPPTTEWATSVPSAPPPLATDPAHGVRLEGLNVLVVDDEVAITTAMSALLSSFGARVVTASGSGSAMQAVQAHPELDIAIIDFRLGAQETGIDLAPRLAEARGKPLPFAVITGDTGPAEIQRLRDSGATVCFKPLEANILLDTIIQLSNATR